MGGVSRVGFCGVKFGQAGCSLRLCECKLACVSTHTLLSVLVRALGTLACPMTLFWLVLTRLGSFDFGGTVWHGFVHTPLARGLLGWVFRFR